MVNNLCEKGYCTPTAAKTADLILNQMFVGLFELVLDIAQLCLAEQVPDSFTEMQGCPNPSLKWHLLLITWGNCYLFENTFLLKEHIEMACKKSRFNRGSNLSIQSSRVTLRDSIVFCPLQ